MKGKFKPKHPEKYIGDPSNIVYRSSYELKFCRYLDNNKNVMKWGSEEFSIPYISPMDNKYHRYFPDFIVKKKNSKGGIDTLVVEVKPKHQTAPPAPQSSKRPSKRYLNEVYAWGINSAKWEAARKFCLNKGWEFVIITEIELGIKY